MIAPEFTGPDKGHEVKNVAAIFKSIEIIAFVADIQNFAGR
jgi:hypothetical protein